MQRTDPMSPTPEEVALRVSGAAAMAYTIPKTNFEPHPAGRHLPAFLPAERNHATATCAAILTPSAGVATYGRVLAGPGNGKPGLAANQRRP